MGRDLRYFEPNSLVDVSTVTIQNRYLLRPSPDLNDRVVGILGRAQRMYEMTLCATVVLSTHYHLLAVPEDAQHLADFMGFVNTNLSKKIGRLHNWPGKLWADRYHSVPVSMEEEAQIARLRYVLAAGVKELLVDRPAEWPGVHGVEALISGTPLVGHWYNWTKEYAARQLRGEKDVDEASFAEEERLVLSPLPCWAHVPEGTWRGWVRDLVVEIEEEGERERRRTRRESLGAKKIVRTRPHKRPAKVEKSPKPRFHAVKPEVFKRMWEAWREVTAAFRVAAAQLLAGELDVEFPEGTFPPALPFVPFALACRGDPV